MGVFHAVSSFHNAGFDLTGSSLVPFAQDPLLILTHAALIITGGLGYAVLLEIGARVRSPNHPWTLHARFVLMITAILLVVGTLGTLAIEWGNPHTLGQLAWPSKILDAFFQSVTARTAGFTSLDTGLMHPASQFLTIMLMFIGASPGSTGGGIKTTTFAILLWGVFTVIRQHPDITSHGRRITWDFFSRAVAIVFLAASVVLVMTAAVLLTNHAGFLEALFETTSAFGTVGLSMGLTPHLTTTGRVLIVVTMFLGRVGPLTAAVALLRQARPPASIRYPEAQIPIG